MTMLLNAPSGGYLRQLKRMSEQQVMAAYMYYKRWMLSLSPLHLIAGWLLLLNTMVISFPSSFRTNEQMPVWLLPWMSMLEGMNPPTSSYTNIVNVFVMRHLTNIELVETLERFLRSVVATFWSRAECQQYQNTHVCYPLRLSPSPMACMECIFCFRQGWVELGGAVERASKLFIEGTAVVG
jgi:hypothetical protein